MDDEWAKAAPLVGNGWDQPSSSAAETRSRWHEPAVEDDWRESHPNLVETWYPPTPKANVSSKLSIALHFITGAGANYP